jgi:hypothetical protein
MRPEIEIRVYRNRRLEMSHLARPGKTLRLTGSGLGLASHHAAGQVFGQVGNQTELCVRS